MLFSLIKHTHQWRAVTISLAILFVLIGCGAGDNEKGIIARVNGSPIFFADADAQRNIFFGGLDKSGTPPSDATLTIQYAYTLRQLIVQELIRQFLEEKKLLPTKDMLEEELEGVRGEYGTDFFRILLEDGISPELWEKAMYRQLVVKCFLDKVLKQQIIFTPEEIETYYKTHIKDFTVPEQFHFMEISGRVQSDVEKAQKAILSGSNATAIQHKFNVSVREVSMGKERLPEATVKEILTLEPKKLGHIVKSTQGFISILLLEVLPEQVLGTMETYKRIESALLEDRLEEAYILWVKKNMSKATIKIAKGLKNADSLHALIVKENTNATQQLSNSTTKTFLRYSETSQD